MPITPPIPAKSIEIEKTFMAVPILFKVVIPILIFASLFASFIKKLVISSKNVVTFFVIVVTLILDNSSNNSTSRAVKSKNDCIVFLPT